MPKFNDINLENWKESDIETDSLWIINSRDNTGKHDGFYHGNFVPQIPRQLIKRFTKKGEVVLDMFAGSGTTNFEAESLQRSCIGVELKQDLVDLINNKLDKKETEFNFAICKDSADKEVVSVLKGELNKRGKEKVQLVILHPPYADIIKFSVSEKDLSNQSIENFFCLFSQVLENAKTILEKDRYLAIVIGDKYSNGELVPLGFECMQLARLVGFSLKGIIVKNMSGNREKQNKEQIWRYRALSSDYYIFKHEYIFIFKNRGAKYEKN